MRALRAFSYVVTFNTNVTGVDPTDFQVTTDGAVQIFSINCGHFRSAVTSTTVTVSGIHGKRQFEAGFDRQ